MRSWVQPRSTSQSTASSGEPSGGSSGDTWPRFIWRTASRSSARLTSWKYKLNAPASASASPTSMLSSSAAIASPAAASFCSWNAIERWRHFSTRSRSPAPPCSAMTCPRSEPSSLTSRDSGSRAPAEPTSCGSARTAAFRAGRRRGWLRLVRLTTIFASIQPAGQVPKHGALSPPQGREA